MLDVFNTASLQAVNYQEFYGGGTTRDWVKPRGASMVRFMLIGAGGGGDVATTVTGGQGGGSGAITQWIGPAIFVPDVLRVSVGAGGASGAGGTATTLVYQAKDGTGYTLLNANAGSLGSGAGATANNYFGASGIYFNVAGMAGSAADTDRARSGATFLCGGAGGGSGSGSVGGLVEGLYGYQNISGGAATVGGAGSNGYFITQPFFLGFGGAGGGGSTGTGGNGGRGGIGCGGGGGGRGATAGTVGNGGRGGDGAVFVWAW